MTAAEVAREILPTLNACLNGLSAALVACGWIAIRKGHRSVHRKLMAGALTSSTLFLASYLTRVALVGSHPFAGVGAARVAYLAVLLSHMLLAAAVVPMVLVTVVRALRSRFPAHRRIGRWALPVWLYVSVTGVVVYLMLYHWPRPEPPSTDPERASPRTALRRPVPVALLAVLTGCGQDEFTEPMILGGRSIQPETLNLGRQRYIVYCRQCHGDRGAGDGPAAPGLRPPPRNFTQGLFKFAAVPAGELPHDSDLVRIAAGGLHGTAMLPWQVPDEELDAIIQYIKTFSPKWRAGRPGPRIEPTPDPWRGRRAEAERRGFEVYHGFAECWSCHPAYGTRQEIFDAYRTLRGAGSRDFRADMYQPVPKESEYGVSTLPTEFLRDPVRSVRWRPAQCASCHGDRGVQWFQRHLEHHELADFYRIIASGIGGTAMPAWRDNLAEDQIWAMAYYVRSLSRMRDSPRAEALRERLANQPAFVSPPHAAAPEAAPPSP